LPQRCDSEGGSPNPGHCTSFTEYSILDTLQDPNTVVVRTFETTDCTGASTQENLPLNYCDVKEYDCEPTPGEGCYNAEPFKVSRDMLQTETTPVRDGGRAQRLLFMQDSCHGGSQCIYAQMFTVS
jgi:hypothetical protein